MIAIDTNVLLRHLLQDDAQQARRAARLLREHRPVLLTDIVLAETLWTLAGKKYRLAHSDIVAVLEGLFDDPALVFENRMTVWRAKEAYARQVVERFGFSDALIIYKAGQLSRERGEQLVAVYSFDKAVQQLPLGAAP